MVSTFVERIEEVRKGIFPNNQNLLVEFEKRVSRGEVDIHHHHAEYQPVLDPLDEASGVVHDHSHDNVFSHSHDHTHTHTHNRYRHISHPNGPRTMIDEGVCCCFMSQFPKEVIEEERLLRTEKTETDKAKC